MKLATWNVNSLRVRLPQVLSWLQETQIDVLCLQETKQDNTAFPHSNFQDIGYHSAHNGQKTYNGVALLSRHPLVDVTLDIPNFADEQKRVISAEVQGIRVISAYVPNGQMVGSEKYTYKLSWLTAFTHFLQDTLKTHPQLAVLGDYNIAPEDLDCHDPEAWLGKILVSPAERSAFQDLLDLGLFDSFRLFDKSDGHYSWWDYRGLGFRRNLGMRIDHILISTPLKEKSVGSWIDKTPRKSEQPSDHTPVILELAL